jgi:hypothetical protein
MVVAAGTAGFGFRDGQVWWVHLGWSGNHRVIAERSAAAVATPVHPPRLVMANTWEAVYFDHDLGALTKLADAAAEVGAERFVLDDGWFRHRRDDTAGLGDWYVDDTIWPDGLHTHSFITFAGEGYVPRRLRAGGYRNDGGVVTRSGPATRTGPELEPPGRPAPAGRSDQRTGHRLVPWRSGVGAGCSGCTPRPAPTVRPAQWHPRRA